MLQDARNRNDENKRRQNDQHKGNPIMKDLKLPPRPPKYVAHGRIADLLRSRPDAHLLATKPPENIFGDYQVKRYTSRLALETFLQNPGQWSALVHNLVAKNMVCYPAFEVSES